jgi:antirestriction protein
LEIVFVNNAEPRIYVACLAAYNNGCLHGEWINANQDADSLHEEVKKILSASPIPRAEEFAIHDFENFGDVQIIYGIRNCFGVSKFHR